MENEIYLQVILKESINSLELQCKSLSLFLFLGHAGITFKRLGNLRIAIEGFGQNTINT